MLEAGEVKMSRMGMYLPAEASHLWFAGGRPRGLVVGTVVVDDAVRRLSADDTTSDQEAREVVSVVEGVVTMDLVTGRETGAGTGWSR